MGVINTPNIGADFMTSSADRLVQSLAIDAIRGTILVLKAQPGYNAVPLMAFLPDPGPSRVAFLSSTLNMQTRGPASSSGAIPGNFGECWTTCEHHNFLLRNA
jgi:hypothetical protein